MAFKTNRFGPQKGSNTLRFIVSGAQLYCEHNSRLFLEGLDLKKEKKIVDHKFSVRLCDATPDDH